MQVVYGAFLNLQAITQFIDVYTVIVRGVDKDGKKDESSGSVSIAGLRAMDLANAMMWLS